jgi:starch phosphorylase
MTNQNGKSHREQHLARLKDYIQHREVVEVQVEDARTGISVEALKRAFAHNLYYTQGKDGHFATAHDYYMALAYTVRDRLIHRRLKTAQTYLERDVKLVYYLSLEFLMGRQLANNLLNTGLYERARRAVKEFGLNLHELLEQEEEPGLGNGGLGRLAACFLDSLATLEIPAQGYGIRYEFGIFHQVIRDGWQWECPDKWLSFGYPWEIPRPDYRVEVGFGGHTQTYLDESERTRVQWVPERTLVGTPYDTLVPGYNTNTVSKLRLWKAEASEEFDFHAFSAGDFTRAVANKTLSENISKVLYPNDHTEQGRRLRLEQQYFFVSCSLQDIIRLYLRSHDNFARFHEKVAIQLNDTHPAIAIVELMRLLIDEYHLEWDRAWQLVQQVFSYTNHTLLPEALERWSVNLFAALLPRHLEIIYEINHRFLEDIRAKYPGDINRLNRLSLIEEGAEKQIRMAHLACLGSHAINGVAALHTDLLRQELFRDFYELHPEKFSNKTNGITPRRWLALSNPRLANLLTQKIGKQWVARLADLKWLEAYVDDREFLQQWQQIKQGNKQELAAYIYQVNGIEIDSHSLFDIQVKRIHEYKRQLLSVLHIITLFNRIKHNVQVDILPRTFIFAGKAAPGYYIAKLIIKLINSVAEIVNHDSDVKNRLKVVFLANYCVSLGERIYPAADLSEQISTAGKEASGTGNMKFALNGAVTIGTLDGANIELREEVGPENFFAFGLTTNQISSLKRSGYHPWDYYSANSELREAIDQIAAGYFSPGDPGLFRPITDELLRRDEYLLLADYQSYLDCQEQIGHAYQDPDYWTRMSILNVARISKFSSDRTIREYCQDIWQVKPVPIELEEVEDQKEMGLRLVQSLPQSN